MKISPIRANINGLTYGKTTDNTAFSGVRVDKVKTAFRNAGKRINWQSVREKLAKGWRYVMEWTRNTANLFGKRGINGIKDALGEFQNAGKKLAH